MFFGYFLNIKKVTPSADFVIGPAKAGAFLFSHTRLPVPAPAEATTDRAVSRSEMEPNGDKRRPAPCGTNVRAAGGARLPGHADGNRREMQE